MAAAATALKQVVIDVVSDTICPWCFIGKRRLDAAIRAAADMRLGVEVVVRWHPFFLDPGLPDAGIEKMKRYQEKFGADRVAQMLPYMARVGAADGIKFNFGGKVANTLDSHRVIELAYLRGGASLQDRVVESLFKFYFEEEGNPGDRAALTEAAVRGGLARADVESTLASDLLKTEVLTEAKALQVRHRITGVPFFIVDGRYKLSGAQEAATFVEVFRELSDA